MDDKLIFIIPRENFGKFSHVGVPADLDCYYMTWEDVANETVVPGARCETTSSRYKSLR